MDLNVINEMELSYLFETDCLCMIDNLIYFSAKNFDALISIDLESHVVRIEDNFEDRYKTSYCAHTKIVHYKHSIFCVPRYSQYFIKYDLLTKQSIKIKLPNIKDSRSVFGEAVQINDKIVCFPEFYENIVIIDMKSGQIIMNELKNDTSDKYLFASNAVKNQDVVLIPFYNKNQILKFDSSCNRFTFINVESNSAGFTSITWLEDKIYLMGREKILYIVNNEGKLLTTEENLDGILYALDESVWLISKGKNEIYMINPSTLEIEQYQVCDKYTEVLKDSTLIRSELIGEFIYIILQTKNSEMGILRFNSEESYYTSIYVETLYEDFLKNKCILEEHSKVLLPLVKRVIDHIVYIENKVGNIGERIFNVIKDNYK